MRAVALAILATSLSQAAALAADFDSGPLRGTQYVEPMAAPVALWEGVYFGGFGGYTQTDFHTKSLSTVSAGFVDPRLTTSFL
jgi:outer membrane immunogenic protein